MRTNAFIADLAELAVKHFRSCVDRTRLSEENGCVSILFRNVKSDSALEITATDAGIDLGYGSLTRRIGQGREINAIFARAASEVLAILAGDLGAAVVRRDGIFLRGAFCERGEEEKAASGLAASPDSGESVWIRYWSGPELPFPVPISGPGRETGNGKTA